MERKFWRFLYITVYHSLCTVIPLVRWQMPPQHQCADQMLIFSVVPLLCFKLVYLLSPTLLFLFCLFCIFFRVKVLYCHSFFQNRRGRKTARLASTISNLGLSLNTPLKLMWKHVLSVISDPTSNNIWQHKKLQVYKGGDTSICSWRVCRIQKF